MSQLCRIKMTPCSGQETNNCHIYCGLPLIRFALEKLIFLLNQANSFFSISEFSLIVYVSWCWLTAVLSHQCFASVDAWILVVFWHWRISADLLVAMSAYFDANECEVISVNTLHTVPQRQAGSVDGCWWWGLGIIIAFSGVEFIKSPVMSWGLDSVSFVVSVWFTKSQLAAKSIRLR